MSKLITYGMLFLYLAFFVMVARAEPMRGQDILGLAMQDVDMIAANIEPGTALGVLQGTFGNVIPALDKLLATGKPSAFRAHILNGCCHRNGNCERGEPKPTDVRAIGERAKRLGNLALKYPQIKCYLSPVLEHDVKDEALVKSWIAAIKQNAPTCTPIISAFTGVYLAGVLRESHNWRARGFHVLSPDGTSGFDIDHTSYGTGRETMLFNWIPRYNLRPAGFIPPSKRTAKVSKDELLQAQRLLHPQETKPTGKPPQCESVRAVGDPPKGWNPKKKQPNPNAKELWKTNGEDKDNGDVRANKPVFISRYNLPTIDLINSRGNKVAYLRYFGTYPPAGNGFHRHYLGTGSNLTPVALMDKNRGEWLWLDLKKECVLVNAIRRKGYYR